MVVHVDMLFNRGQRVRELLHEQDLLQREEGGGHACKKAEGKGDLQVGWRNMKRGYSKIVSITR